VFNFKIKRHILFTVDQKQVIIINTKGKSHLIINYPEAAVWCVLIEKHITEKTTRMLMAVLMKNEADTTEFIGKCLKKWVESDIIE